MRRSGNDDRPRPPGSSRGGSKRSGHGKDLSLYGLEDSTRVEHVMSNIEG